MCRRAVACLFSTLVCASWTAPAAAQYQVISSSSPAVSQREHSVTEQPRFGARVDTPRLAQRWYGWETLSLDAAALGLGVMSYSTFDGKGSAGALLGSGGLSTYAFGAPAVHLLRDQPNRAVASLGLRVGLPVLAVGLASISADDERCSTPDEARCAPYRRRLLLAGVVSATLAALIDGAALAWEPVDKPQRLALTPLVGWDGSESGVAGVAGTF